MEEIYTRNLVIHDCLDRGVQSSLTSFFQIVSFRHATIKLVGCKQF